MLTDFYFKHVLLMFVCFFLIWLSLRMFTFQEVQLYSRTSVAGTLMARLPQLFRTRSWGPRKKTLAADWDNLVWFSFLYWKQYILCTN